MDGLMNVFWILGSYIVVIILLFIILNFLTKGYIVQYLKVKMSRGRLTLIKCNDVTDGYYKAGKIDNKRNLILKDRYNKIHTFANIQKTDVNRELGINLIEVDLVKGLLINRDFSNATGYDLTMMDELVNRAIMLPKLKKDEIWENVQKMILILILIGIGICIYLLVMNQPECIINNDVVNI